MWLALLWTWGCTPTTTADVILVSPEPTGDTSTPSSPPGTTWWGQVRPLTDRHCAACHVDGGMAPFAFDDPEEMQVLGPSVVDAVRTRTMPPYSFRPGCRAVEGDPSLDDATVAVFEAWEVDGFPVGDPADYVPPTSTQTGSVPPDLELRPLRPFAPDTTLPDHYLCMVSEVAFAEETFVTWSDLVPERVDIVHHATVYAVPPERMGELARIAGGDTSGQFDCFSAPVAALGPVLAGGVPGSSKEPPEGPRSEAIRVPAGSKAVFEMHYNTVNHPEPGVTDNPTVRLWTAPESEVESLAVVWFLQNVEIEVPAGLERVEHTLDFRVPIEARVRSTGPHMHVLGTELRTVITRGSGVEECLSDVDYDFDWRRHYAFPPGELPTFSSSAGDAVRLTCVYDNSAANQPIVDGVRQEPRDVSSGSGTQDEMCADYMSFQVPFDPTASRGLCGGYDRCYQQCPPEDPACPLACMGVGGTACYTCGAAAMFGPCTTRACPAKGAALRGCLDRCDHFQSDYFGCMVEECAERLAAYQACAQPLFADGTCAEDYEACSGLTP